MPSCSVIIPAHNYEAYIDRAIGSVLRQSFTDFELIVVDDGSTDRTSDIVKKFANVRYIYQESKGLSAARNAGVRASQGEFIAFLDADDEWLPGKLALQIEKIQTDQTTAVVYTGEYVCDDVAGRETVRLCSARGLILESLLRENCVVGSCSSSVVRRSCLDDVGEFDTKLSVCEDWDLWLRIATSCRYRFEFVNEPLIKYHLHDENLHHDMVRMLEGHLMVLDKFFSSSTLPADILDLEGAVRAHWLARFAPHFYWSRDLSRFRRSYIAMVRNDWRSVSQVSLLWLFLKSFAGKSILDLVKSRVVP